MSPESAPDSKKWESYGLNTKQGLV